MKYNEDKVNECTLALMSLVVHMKTDYGALAWKGFDWETMNRLHKKGFIADPVGKAKSVMMTVEGRKLSEKLFQKLFGEE